ncbi:MAG: N-acetyl-gamma-glutamyl-phosphate reductase [Robiginitomaculum sp.]|nr:N-acetyl-gamma-glutamyl-phosphate reductase [Robiginitomaculum sp.]
MSKKRIGLVGGRGFVGGELIRLLGDHEQMQLAFASSSSKAGSLIAGTDLDFISLQPEQLQQHDFDALALALPNDKAKDWVEVVDASGRDICILDISADYRFYDDWVYGLPEINKKHLVGAKRISNPGCYATAAQLALYPLRNLLVGTPVIFGVSGYSGAGATPSSKNDPDNLKDNLLPYSLCGHIHEREIGFHLGREVHFSPHVAAFFRGISLTIHLDFTEKVSVEQVNELLGGFYQTSSFVEVNSEIPNLQTVINTPMVKIGGLNINESQRHGVIVVVLDNLLKGAASQAVQNLELALDIN